MAIVVRLRRESLIGGSSRHGQVQLLPRRSEGVHRVASTSVRTPLLKGPADVLVVVIGDESLTWLLGLGHTLGLSRPQHRIRQIFFILLFLQLQAVDRKLLVPREVLQMVHILITCLLIQDVALQPRLLVRIVFVIVNVAFDLDILIGHVAQVRLLLASTGARRNMARCVELLLLLLLFAVLHSDLANFLQINELYLIDGIFCQIFIV